MAIRFAWVLVLSGCGAFGTSKFTLPPIDTIVPLQVLGFTTYQHPVTGKFFARQLPAAGGLPPYSWTLTAGSLPTGLSLSANGELTGTPTATGNFKYTLTITDSKGATASGAYSDTTMSSGSIAFSFPPLPVSTFGQNEDFGFEFFIEGGVPPYSFNVTGLPAGLSFEPTTGTLYGKPTGAGTLNLTISVVDSTGAVAQGSPQSASFEIAPPRPAGGGGANGIGCPSAYDGDYAGLFNYEYQTGQPPNVITQTASVRVSVTLQCLAAANGSVVLNVTHAAASDPYFGCTLGGCTPMGGSVATLPSTLPTFSSAAGQGIEILFANGASLGTSNQAGDLSVSNSNGDIISNSLMPSDPMGTWVAASTAAGGAVFPNAATPATSFKSWSLTRQ